MWVLILSSLVVGPNSRSSSVAMHEFSSYKTCAVAGQTFQRQHRATERQTLNWSCVRK
jgi:hypothetical protein